MVKWIALLFLAALIASVWYASQDGAPGWAPVLPTLVIAAGVLAGIAYAMLEAKRRQKELGEAAARLGLKFEDEKRELKDSGLSVLKQFAHFRPGKELPFLLRGNRVSFQNVMSGREGDAEFYLLDYYTSKGKSGHLHGTFACFRLAGGRLPDLEILPRKLRRGGKWVRELLAVPPVRQEVAAGQPSFTEEYCIESAEPGGVAEIIAGPLGDFLTDPRNAGWHIEAAGEWLAVTRMGVSPRTGRIRNPMHPESLAPEKRGGYSPAQIDPEDIPEFHRFAVQIFRWLAGR